MYAYVCTVCVCIYVYTVSVFSACMHMHVYSMLYTVYVCMYVCTVCVCLCVYKVCVFSICIHVHVYSVYVYTVYVCICVLCFTAFPNKLQEHFPRNSVFLQAIYLGFSLAPITCIGKTSVLPSEEESFKTFVQVSLRIFQALFLDLAVSFSFLQGVI